MYCAYRDSDTRGSSMTDSWYKQNGSAHVVPAIHNTRVSYLCTTDQQVSCFPSLPDKNISHTDCIDYGPIDLIHVGSSFITICRGQKENEDLNTGTTSVLN